MKDKQIVFGRVPSLLCAKVAKKRLTLTKILLPLFCRVRKAEKELCLRARVQSGTPLALVGSTARVKQPYPTFLIREGWH